MLVFTAVVPHSPLLLPSIGKEHRSHLVTTLDAYQEIEESLYAARPDTLLVISPHAPLYQDAFSANLSDRFVGTTKEFGDHGTSITAQADYLLLDHIHRAMREAKIPFTLTSNTEIDYGLTVPLLLLTEHFKNWKLAPLSISGLDTAAHLAFGEALGHVIQEETHRIAVIISVDLSHHANAAARGGARAEGAAFDQAVQEAIRTKNEHLLEALSPTILEQAEQCAHKPLLVLFGLLKDLQVTPHIHSYEAPFGVGYLTAQFDLV